MPHAPLLLAFGLANLPMLGWLGMAAAPIIIHLLSRRKYRETTWAAMEYLLAAMKRQKRKILIEQWLLLLLRTLLVVLVVLAVAEPYWENAALPFARGGRTHRVLVLDASYSMAYRPTDKTRFERAKELAGQIVDESSPGDGFSLVLMAARPRVVIAAPSFEPSQIHEEIEGLELTHAGADLPATIGKVQEVLDKSRQESPRLLRHEVYFLTDMQRASWAPNLSEAARAEFRRQSEALAQSAALVLVDLGQPAAENLAVTALRAVEPGAAAGRAEPVVTVGRKVELEADLRNFGRQEHAAQPVNLWIDGRRIEQKQVRVPAGEQSTAKVKFDYRFETPGDHAIEVRTDGDALEVDNRRYRVVSVRQSLRALCVNGRPSGERFHGATDYLAAALRSRVPGVEQPRIEVDAAPENALLERDLGNYDCVLLANVAQFTASEARALDAYLGHGGSLVFFLGNQVQPERYNRELGGEAAGTRILPGRLGAIAENRDAGLNALGYRHPIVREFAGRQNAGVEGALVSKYYKLELPRGSKADVVLALKNGDPLVVEQSVRRGRVVLVATSADVSWSPMTVQALYVPLVREVLAWCVAGQRQQRNLEVGEPLVASVAASGADAAVSLTRPDRQTRTGQLRVEGDYAEWSYDDTLQSGIYTMQFGPPVSSVHTFAMNVNTAESDLTPLGIEEFQSEVWPAEKVPITYQTSWQNLDTRAAGAIAQPEQLHVGLLYGVLGLLIVETVLAWRFGHHADK
jgi:hypothetical protein